MSRVNALYHIVFATQNRRMTIANDHREDLYRYIWRIITERNCRLIRIGGIPNHLHLLINLHPTVALSELIRDIKAKSSGWLRRNPDFKVFDGWAKEYFAATVAYKDQGGVIEYIKGQQDHHRITAIEQEIREWMEHEGLHLTDYDLQ